MTYDELLKEYHQFKAQTAALIRENSSLKSQLSQMQAQISMLNRMLFGKRSEKLGRDENVNQIPLFDIPQPTAPEAEKTQMVSYERKETGKKKGHGRNELPENLPVLERIIEPEGDISGLKRIGQETRDILELEPARFYILRLIRPKYADPVSERIIIAPMPHLPIPRGIPGPKLLAHIYTGKFVDHLPLDRQQKQYERLGVKLPSSTINGWVNLGGKAIISQIYELYRQRICQKTYLQLDETPTKVQTDEIKGKLHRGYFWLYYSPLDGEIFYDYQSGRGRDGPKAILDGFQGWLQSDGFSVYDWFGKQEGIRQVHCMAHARRLFYNLLADKNDQRVQPILELIKKLYKVEKEARHHQYTHDQRLAVRQKKSVPVLEEIKSWLAETLKELTPSDPLAGAIGYMQTRWKTLTVFTEEGLLEIDKNPVENKVKPIPLGRKNWLFHGNEEAAKTAAMAYTLVAQAQNAGLNPQDYLTYLFSHFWDHPHHDLKALLPQNVKIE